VSQVQATGLLGFASMCCKMAHRKGASGDAP
jgi:hypothetical protein